jgi:hypothetical protein
MVRVDVLAIAREQQAAWPTEVPGVERRDPAPARQLYADWWGEFKGCCLAAHFPDLPQVTQPDRVDLPAQVRAMR